MEWITVAIVAIVLTAVIISIVAYTAYIKSKEKAINSFSKDIPIKHKNVDEKIKDLRIKQLFGFYDPDYAKRVGTSKYEDLKGQILEVTHAFTDPYAFQKRKVNTIYYVGPLKRYHGIGKTGQDFKAQNFDFTDVALLFLLHETFFDEYYPYDESLDNHILWTNPNDIPDYDVEHSTDNKSKNVKNLQNIRDAEESWKDSDLMID